MNWLRNFILCAMVATVVACGGKSETGLPAPTDPSAGGPPPTGPKSPTGKTGFCSQLKNYAFEKFEPVALWDASTYSGIEKLFGPMIGNLVGDVKFQMDLAVVQQSGQYRLAGKLCVGHEHKPGWRDRVWDSYMSLLSSGYVTNGQPSGGLPANKFDIVFQDDAVVVRVIADRFGDDLSNGEIYFRERALDQTTAERQACKEWTCGGRACTAAELSAAGMPPETLVQQCRAYVSTQSSNVNLLGSFSGKLSKWVVSQ